jgi:hypothetical protein
MRDNALDLRWREHFFPLPGPALAKKSLGLFRTFAETGFFFLLALLRFARNDNA